jgi:hypothetical protein
MAITVKSKSPQILPKVKKIKPKTPSMLNLSNWNTTDTDEIERRRLRAQTEKMKLYPLEPKFSYFGTFIVSSSKRDTQYSVEIRPLQEHINSCDCQDYQMNGL